MASEPVRMCVGCRERAAKRELVRVTVGSDAHGLLVVTPDPRGLAPGRGAHLHPTTVCVELALRKKAFGRALRVTGARLDTTEVAAYVAAREAEQDQQSQQDQTVTEDREEGWSSSS